MSNPPRLPSNLCAPLPTLDQEMPQHVVLIRHRNGRVISQKLIAHGTAQVADAMNDVASRPQDSAIYCACRSKGLQRLYLRCHKDKDLLLVCAPRTKSRHAESCIYGGASSVKSDSTSLFDITHDADWRQSINRPLPIAKGAGTKRRHDRSEHPEPRPKAPGSRRLRRTRLVGNLLHVMNAAGTSEYFPSSCSTNGSFDVLSKLAGALTADHTNSGTVQRTFVLGAGVDPSLERMVGAIEENKSGTVPIVIVAELEGRKTIASGMMMLRLRGSDHSVMVRGSQWRYACGHGASSATQSAVDEMDGVSPTRMRLFALMHVVADADGRLEAKRIGLVVTNAQGIPVESSHELEVADRLVALGRHFIKHMFRVTGYPYLHDFVLLDAGFPFVIEVNGMESDSYREAKMRMKEFLDRNSHGRYLMWWVKEGPFPADRLPPIASTA